MSKYFAFNENLIHDIANVVSITRVLLPKRTVQTLDIPSRDGLIYNGSKFDPLEYDLQFVIEGTDQFDLIYKTGILRDILQINQLCKVAFDDKKYGYGMFIDNIPVTEKCDNKIVLSGHLICYIPYFYAEDYNLSTNASDTSLITFENNGGLPTRPFMTIGFSKDAHFIQLQNQINKHTLLIGKYPSLELTSYDEQKNKVVDTCTSTSNWPSSSVTIDGNRGTGGSLAIANNQNGFILGTLPSSSGSEYWKGVQARRNLTNAIEEFEISIDLTCKSTGVNGDPSVIPTKIESVTAGGDTYYYQVTATTLNVRTGPSTSYKLVGTVKRGYRINAGTNLGNVGGWIRFYDSNIASGALYASAAYMKLYTVTDKVTTTKRNVVVDRNTPIHAQPKMDSTTLITIPKNGVCRIYSTTKYTSLDSDGKERSWYKLAEKYEGYDGYICAGNLYEMTTDPVYILETDSTVDTADDKTGIIEVYGMGTNNERIFKFEISDNNEYYENNKPKLQIGLNSVYEDVTVVPKPNSYTSNSNGTIKITNYLSGQVGNWNDFNGVVKIKRVKRDDEGYDWTYSINKVDGGTIVKREQGSIAKSAIDSSSSKLAYLVLYIGTHTSLAKCTDMSLNEVTIITNETTTSTDVDKVLFHEADILDIDFENRNVYLNKVLRNDLIDIGSIFFNIEKGINPIKIFTNDNDVIVGGVINEKWIGAE